MVLLGLGIAGVIGLTIRVVYSSVSGEVESPAFVKQLMCSGCGHRYEGPISSPPITCPKCGKQAVWAAMQCMKCRTIIANDRRKFRAEGREPYCPKCKTTGFIEVQDRSSGQRAESR